MSDRERAEAVLRIKPSAEIVAGVVELGWKADDGTLMDNEQREYELLIDAGNLVATMKSKARRFLDENPK